MKTIFIIFMLALPALGAEINSESLNFECSTAVDGTEPHAKLTVNDCRSLGTSVTDMALNGRVFKTFTLTAIGDKRSLSARFAATLENYIANNKLNPSAKGKATVKVTSLDLTPRGKLTGTIENFLGERLPITKTDRIALSVLYNIRSYDEAKKAILKDMYTLSEASPEHKLLLDKAGLRSSLLNDDLMWPIALGAGYGCKTFFDMLKSYYDRVGPGHKVIFRTTNAHSNWVNSTFEGEWHHKIEVVSEDIGLEYYSVPGSYIFAFRMIPPGSDPSDVSNYAIVTAAPPIWRADYSVQSPRDTFVVTNMGVRHQDSGDIAEVVGTAGAPFGVGMVMNWTQYTDIVSIKAQKLYMGSDGAVKPGQEGAVMNQIQRFFKRH